MMRALFLLLLLTSMSLTSQAHEFKMGLFEINQDGEELSLFVRLDRKNLLEAVACLDYNEIDNCFQDYINSHMVLLLNEQAINPQLSQTKITDEYVELEYFLSDEIDKVQLIEFTNTCLIAAVDDHINLLKLNLNGQKRAFRLDKDRMSTKINFS